MCTQRWSLESEILVLFWKVGDIIDFKRELFLFNVRDLKQKQLYLPYPQALTKQV